jgi:hypothetical protein
MHGWVFKLFLMLVVMMVAMVLATETSGQNPITSPLEGIYNQAEVIPVTWKATTSGTISLYLLKGPQTDLSTVAALAGTTLSLPIGGLSS